MNKFIKKLFGIDKIEEATLDAETKLKEATDRATKIIADAAETERLSKLNPKELATEKKESYIAVLDTKVNKDNVRNGFFELDWNQEFITQLKQAGYGFDEDPEEEIVDRWFRDLARNMLSEDGLDTSRGAGYINVSRLPNGRAQVE